MAEIAPLTPIRYDLQKSSLAKVVAPPYDVIDAAQRAELCARDPHNVVRLILPEGEGDRKYANAAELLDAWRKDGTLVRDDEPAFYRYDQTFTPPGGGAKKTRTGFLALVKLVPFSARTVLPHERTLSGPKEDRLKLFRATRTNLSPGFMLYRDPERALDAAIGTAKPLARFTTADGVDHVLSKIASPDAVRTIVDGIGRSSLLIADGHHRYETALRYAEETGAKGRSANGFFMAFLANGDDPNLLVFPTHRHVHGLTGFSFDALLSGVADTFDVTPLPKGASAEQALADLEKTTSSVVAAAPSGELALITLKNGADLGGHPTLAKDPEALRTTDVALLHTGILEHVLGITREAQAQKTNLWYPQDARAALEKLRRGGAEGGDVLFLMNATPVEHVRRVAEAGHVMPQKSTFFHPKVMTGLAIHTLEPDRAV